jgi:uncharacterized OB-fold protein
VIGKVRMAQVSVQDTVLTGIPGEPRLIGGKCPDCGNVVFPMQKDCPKCTGDQIEKVELSTKGVLWTWTIQGFPPKSPPYIGETDPETFEAYGVGYVELPGEVKVETRLTENDPTRLRVGMEMELTVVPLAIDEEGNEVVTFAFQPIENN